MLELSLARVHVSHEAFAAPAFPPAPAHGAPAAAAGGSRSAGALYQAYSTVQIRRIAIFDRLPAYAHTLAAHRAAQMCVCV
jgi:hypothetical protein